MMTPLTGTLNMSTVSSSRRTLHAIALPFLLRAEDNAGAEAELMTSDDEYCVSFRFTISLTLHRNFDVKLLHRHLSNRTSKFKKLSWDHTVMAQNSICSFHVM